MPIRPGETPWLVLPAAGMTLAMLMWLMGGLGGRGSIRRLSPIDAGGHVWRHLAPHSVLRNDRPFLATCSKTLRSISGRRRKDSWISPRSAATATPSGSILPRRH